MSKDKLIKSGVVTSLTQSTPLFHDGAMFTDISWPGMLQKQNKIFLIELQLLTTLLKQVELS